MVFSFTTGNSIFLKNSVKKQSKIISYSEDNFSFRCVSTELVPCYLPSLFMRGFYPLHCYWIYFPACFVRQPGLEAAALKGMWGITECSQLHAGSLCDSWATGLMQYISELAGECICIGRLCYLQFGHKCSYCWTAAFVLISTDKYVDRLGREREIREAVRTVKGLQMVLSKEGSVTELGSEYPPGNMNLTTEGCLVQEKNVTRTGKYSLAHSDWK